MDRETLLNMTAAIVLASGLSRRFGDGDKLMEGLAGRPLAAHVGETLARVPLARRIAVCASRDVAAVYRDLGFEVVRNEMPEAGMGHSLRLGIGQAGRPASILVCLADMPLVDKGHLMALFDAATKAPDRVVASALGERRSPPALFPRPALEGVDLSGDRGARPLLRDAVPVQAQAETLLDVDDRETLGRVRAIVLRDRG